MERDVCTLFWSTKFSCPWFRRATHSRGNLLWISPQHREEIESSENVQDVIAISPRLFIARRNSLPSFFYRRTMKTSNHLARVFFFLDYTKTHFKHVGWTHTNSECAARRRINEWMIEWSRSIKCAYVNFACELRIFVFSFGISGFGLKLGIFKGIRRRFFRLFTFRRTWVNLWSSALRYVYNRTRTARLVRFDGREERGGEKEKTARGRG